MKSVLILLLSIIIMLLSLLTGIPAFCQILHPADWEFKVSTRQIKSGDNLELFFRVTLEDTWYIYSTDQDPEVGPLPADIAFDSHDSFKLIGKPVPVGVKQKYDKVWKDSVRIIDESGGGFRQKVKIIAENPVIRGTISYSVCSMKTGQCVFPEEDFEFTGISVIVEKDTQPGKKGD